MVGDGMDMGWIYSRGERVRLWRVVVLREGKGVEKIERERKRERESR